MSRGIGIGSGERDDRGPVLGVVLLDSQHYGDSFGSFTPDEVRGLGCLPVGFFESPATWPVPTVFCVAEGSGGEGVLRADEQAIIGLEAAVRRLEPITDAVVADCGFFWAARKRARLPGVTFLSGLDLLDVLLSTTQGPIGVLTYSESDAIRLLSDTPGFARLRIVGVRHLPSWAALGRDDFVAAGGWSVASLEQDLVELAKREIARGRLQDVQAVLLECTIMHQFVRALRELTSVPILDVGRFVRTALAAG